MLVEALDDDAMDWVFGPGGPEWYAGWRSADHALRQITHATPIDEPKQRSPIKGQREKVRDAWRKWYDGRLPKAAKKKPGFVDLTIRDRFVKLTWLLLSADGAGMWTGFDASPDHSADPFALSPAAAGKIAELVTKLEPLTPRTRVVGYKGNRDYQLVIRHSTGVREIYIGKAATTEPPPAVRDLLAALWKTRKRGEPVSVHEGFTETDGHLLEVRAREGRLTYLEVFQKAPGGGSSEGGCSREQFAQLAGTLMKTEQGRAGTTSAPHSIPAASLSSQHRRTTRR